MTENSGFDAGKRFVRITAERPDGFVAFDFAIGDPDTYVELLLRREAFEEFCRVNDVTLLEPPETERTSSVDDDGFDARNWRLSDVPGHLP